MAGEGLCQARGQRGAVADGRRTRAAGPRVGAEDSSLGGAQKQHGEASGDGAGVGGRGSWRARPRHERGQEEAHIEPVVVQSRARGGPEVDGRRRRGRGRPARQHWRRRRHRGVEARRRTGMAPRRGER